MQKKILFVCLGNICRSPAAKAVMEKQILDEDQQEQIKCDSAGTSSYHEGAQPDIRMLNTLAQRQIAIQDTARPINQDDFNQFDFIIAMDAINYRDIQNMCTDVKQEDKIYLITHFLNQPQSDGVPDPYEYGADAFFHVIDLLEESCRNLLDKIMNNKMKTD